MHSYEFSDNFLFKSFTGLTSLSRNGFSKANRDLPYRLFAELLNHLLLRAKRNIKNKLNRIKVFDTTFIMSARGMNRMVHTRGGKEKLLTQL